MISNLHLILLVIGLLTGSSGISGPTPNERNDISWAFKLQSSLFLHSDRTKTLQYIAEGISDFRTYSKVRYGSKGALVFDALSKIGPLFPALLVDPGFVAFALRKFGDKKAADDFSQFVKANSLENMDPFLAREFFAQSLPKIKLYRAMYLTHEGLINIMQNGITSAAMRHGTCKTTKSLHVNFQQQLWDRVSGSFGKDFDPLISVGSCKPVLKFTISEDLIRIVPKDPNKKWYIFGLNISAINLISKASHLLDTLKYENPEESDLVEAMVYNQIEAREIESVEIFDPAIFYKNKDLLKKMGNYIRTHKRCPEEF